MSKPTPTSRPKASAATVSAALDRLASSRAHWAGAMNNARIERATQPTGFMSLLAGLRTRPVVSLVTGLWNLWSRRRARTAVARVSPSLPLLLKGLVFSRIGAVALGATRRHPWLALSGLALTLAWAGWRRQAPPRPNGRI